MDNQNEGEPKVEAASETKAPESQAITQNEREKALEAELATTKQSLKSVQGVLRKKDEEIKTSSALKSDIEGLNEKVRILAGMLQERQVVPEENLDNISQEKKQDYLKTFDRESERIKVEGEKKRQQEEAIAKLRENVSDIQARTESLGLKDTDEAYIEIKELVETGLIKTAETKLKKLESAKEKTVTEPIKKETDEEVYLRMARAKGLLKSETIIPAGGSGNRQEILKQFNAGLISGEKANEKLRAIGESSIV